MKLKFPKQITILSDTFTIEYNKTHDGGDFSLRNSHINIGVRSVKTNPSLTLSVISHELMEIIYVTLGCRYSSVREENKYLFNFDHQSFETAVQLHSEALQKFIV